MHVLNHKGEHFSVRGPLNVNRSPQGKPVLASIFAGEFDAVAASLAEVVIVDDLAILANLKHILNTQGRPRSEIRVMRDMKSWPEEPMAAADDFQHQFETEDIDGFILSPPITASFSHFVETIVPELKSRGLMRSDYCGSTLRDHLGLPVPIHPAKLERAS
jgi:alkanesulfonate monooxygenase SsuD/methylene tetrahydromethanopterin reductase-like flavin-dependent oxidoreductase (luciferase family)